MGLVFGHMAAQVVATGARLGVADRIGDGEMTAPELAAECEADPVSMQRLLRTLAALGVLREGASGGFSLTAAGALLRSDHPDSVHSLVTMFADPVMVQAWHRLEGCVRTGETAFDGVFGTDFFSYLKSRPELSAQFNAAMSQGTQSTAAALPAAYDFARFTTVVDIGSGDGTLIAAILRRHQGFTGILYDTAEGLAQAGQTLERAEVGDRCDLRMGDFFASVSEGGDLYLCKERGPRLGRRAGRHHPRALPPRHPRSRPPADRRARAARHGRRLPSRPHVPQRSQHVGQRGRAGAHPGRLRGAVRSLGLRAHDRRPPAATRSVLRHRSDAGVSEIEGPGASGAAVFGRAAATYDTVIPFFGHIGARLVELAELVPGERVLDVPCGRGASLFPAAQAVGPGGRVLGVDLAAEMVDLLEADLAEAGTTNAEVRRMDAAHLDLAGGSFSVVLSGFSMHVLDDPEQVAGELARVLRPGGRIAASIPAGQGSEWDFVLEVFTSFAPRLTAPMPLPVRPDFDVLVPLRAGGFIDLQVVDDEIGFTFADEAAWWTWAWSHGMRGFLELLPPDALQELRLEMFDRLGTLRDKQGSIRLGQRAQFVLGRRS